MLLARLSLCLALCGCARGPWTEGVSHEKPFAFARGTVALWVWDTEPLLFQPAKSDAFLRFCAGHGINRVFLQLPRTREPDLRPFGRLIARLSKQGIAAEALDGAPAYVEKANHPLVLAKVDAVIAHNRAAPPEEQFRGFRLDIEPHGLPNFAAERKRLLQDYILLIELVRARLADSGMPLGVDMPFWFDREPLGWGPPGRPRYLLSDAVIERADNVAILAYRTDVYYQNGILDLVRYLLARAHQLGRDVYVAIDTSDSGEEGSFFDDGEADLIAALAEVDRALRPHRPYKGVAIHSYESLLLLHQLPK